MFSRNKNDKPKASSGNKPTLKPSPPSIVSADLEIAGNLSSTGEIHIDGTVVGDIHTRSLLIGPTANITGEIVADQVRVHGSIAGQIKARQVTLAKTAHVVGDILHEDLTIETGAFLEGLCKPETVVSLDESGKISLVKDAPQKVLSKPVDKSGNATETPILKGDEKKAVG